MRQGYHKLSTLFIVMVVLSILLVLGISLGISNYLKNVSREQVLKDSETVLEKYAAQLAGDFEAIQTGLMSVYSADKSFDDMQYLPHNDEQMIAKIAIFKRMQSLPVLYQQLDMVFSYSAFSGDYLSSFISSYSYDERIAIQEASRSWIKSLDQPMRRWQCHAVGEHTFFVNIYSNGDAFIGGIINVRTLLENIAFSGSKSKAIALLFDENELVYSTAPIPEDFILPPDSTYLPIDGEKYLAVTTTIIDNNYSILVLTSESALIQNDIVTLGNAVLFLVSGSILLAGILMLLRHSFVGPVQQLVKTMNRVTDGDLQARVKAEDYRNIEDYRIIGEAFNRSMDQTQLLTKRIYEKELEEQKWYLQNLQMQIAPHFIVNSINIIHSASVANKQDIVQEMCTYLSNHFYYLMEPNRVLVSLGDEAKYTENFLRIQELRFANKFEYSIKIPSFLEHIQVPTMVLKTFVENSVKHAISASSYTRLLVSAKLIDDSDDVSLLLMIEDNGPGYPYEIIESFKAGQPLEYDTDLHTGIWNIKERLALLYGDRASLYLGKSLQGGASTTIVLPLTSENRGDVDVSSFNSR